ASTAAVLYLGSAALVERVFLRAWSRAQEGEAGGGRDRVLSRWLPKLTAPLGRPANLLLAKEVTVFLRDPGQWSQLAVLLALVVVYVYNFSVLPLDDGSPLAAAMREMAALLNLGLAAFVTTSLVVAAIVSLGIAFGAALPRFDAVNPAQIATSFGAVLYMMLCLALISVVVAFEAWPVSRLFWPPVAAGPLGGGESALVGAAFGTVTLVTSAAFVAGRRAGLRYLAALEP